MNDTPVGEGSQEENHKMLWLVRLAGRKMWWFGGSGLFTLTRRLCTVSWQLCTAV